MEDETEEEGVRFLDNNSPSSFLPLLDSWHDSKSDFHRLNGPAVTFMDGETRWYRHGKLHRDDGPARIFPTEGIEYWYRNGEPYEPSAHELIAWKMKKMKEC